MLLHIADILTEAAAAECCAALSRVEWNGGEAVDEHPVTAELSGAVVQALENNPLFMGAALPLRVFPPRFLRHGSGDSEKLQVENAVRQVAGTPHRVRTDLSATLFLTPPEDYDGGELVIEDSFGTHSVKLPAGHLALYASSCFHCVQPVTRGVRLTSSFWVQSMIRQDGQRTVLFDLDMAIQRLTATAPEHPSVKPLAGVYHDLLRMWAEV